MKHRGLPCLLFSLIGGGTIGYIVALLAVDLIFEPGGLPLAALPGVILYYTAATIAGCLIGLFVALYTKTEDSARQGSPPGTGDAEGR